MNTRPRRKCLYSFFLPWLFPAVWSKEEDTEKSIGIQIKSEVDLYACSPHVDDQNILGISLCGTILIWGVLFWGRIYIRHVRSRNGKNVALESQESEQSVGRVAVITSQCESRQCYIDQGLTILFGVLPAKQKRDCHAALLTYRHGCNAVTGRNCAVRDVCLSMCVRLVCCEFWLL